MLLKGAVTPLPNYFPWLNFLDRMMACGGGDNVVIMITCCGACPDTNGDFSGLSLLLKVLVVTLRI